MRRNNEIKKEKKSVDSEDVTASSLSDDMVCKEE